MLRTQKVVDGLDGVECLDRNVYEYRVPVAHRAVPQPGQLHCAKFASVQGFVRDESGGGIDILGQVVVATVSVFDTADEVYGVEVRRGCHHSGSLGVFSVYL